MVIANPIYDTAFKRLLENDSVARFFVGTLMGEQVLSLTPLPIEHIYEKTSTQELAIYRMDFAAVIKTKSGEEKKILIEMQKANNISDILPRFRRYLAEEYQRANIVEGKAEYLPITTIYILGFKLPGIESACFKVERSYIDLITNETLTRKSSFIEGLTHDSYVIQTPKIDSRYQTDLDKLLSIFEQNNFAGSGESLKQYKHTVEGDKDREIKEMVDILHFVGTDPEERVELKKEIYYRQALSDMFGGMWKDIENDLEKIEENKRTIAEKDSLIVEKVRVIAEQDNAIAEKARVIAEKDSAIAEKDSAIEENKRAIAEKDREIEALRRRLEGR
jgi:hypothetical protein